MHDPEWISVSPTLHYTSKTPSPRSEPSQNLPIIFKRPNLALVPLRPRPHDVSSTANLPHRALRRVPKPLRPHPQLHVSNLASAPPRPTPGPQLPIPRLANKHIPNRQPRLLHELPHGEHLEHGPAIPRLRPPERLDLLGSRPDIRSWRPDSAPNAKRPWPKTAVWDYTR